MARSLQTLARHTSRHARACVISAPSAAHTASSMADKDQDVWIKVPSGRPRAMPGHGVWCGSALSLLASMGALAIRWRA